MKIICNKLELSDAISKVSRAVPQKSAISALEGIKVKVAPGELELTAYNLEMGIKTSIKADTQDSGEFVANAKLFNEFARRMAGEDITIEFDETNNTVQLSCVTTNVSFPTVSAEEYPDLPVVDSQSGFVVNQSVLKSMIDMTSYAAAANDSKPILTGILFDIEDGKFNMVAIDGFRLAIRCEDAEPQDKYHFVVPKKALHEVSMLLKDDPEKRCIVCVNERHIIFEINNIFVISRLLEGAFHNYKLSIPSDYKTEIVISKKEFSDCLERCSLIIDDKNKSPIKCEVGNGTVKLSCKTVIGKVNDALAADISGDDVTIGFNNRLMLDSIHAAEGDKIRIRFNGAMKVIEILPLEGESYIYLVMPIQIRN